MKTTYSPKSCGDAHADAEAALAYREDSDRRDLRIASVPDLHAKAVAQRKAIPVVHCDAQGNVIR